MRTNHEQKVKVVNLNYYLTKAENKYKSIEDWPGGHSSEQEPNFTASEVECWNCGERGHYSNECPKPCQEQSGRGRGRGRRRGRGRD